MLTTKCENKSNKTTERLCCFLFFILLYIICGYARIYVCTQGVRASVQENNCNHSHILPLNGLRLLSLQGKHSYLLSRLI